MGVIVKRCASSNRFGTYIAADIADMPDLIPKPHDSPVEAKGEAVFRSVRRGVLMLRC